MCEEHRAAREGGEVKKRIKRKILKKLLKEMFFQDYLQGCVDIEGFPKYYELFSKEQTSRRLSTLLREVKKSLVIDYKLKLKDL